ncbi:MAG: prephenate dehydrogenase [Acidobacteria bacterium]|nr:prephenate dehydrogenase [Acidobacteriota bacterium]
METSAAPRVLIAGLGLIGGSAGMALRRRGWHVSYTDPHVEESAARAAGAADVRLPSVAGFNGGLVIVATPVPVAVDLVQQLLAEENTAAITTVCSVLAPLRQAAGDMPRFVAGHPLAGSQEHGLAAAHADLFVDRRWFIDASNGTVERMIADCAAVAERTDPHQHDDAVALTSHLPQILSTALAAELAERPELLRFAGPGLRTFLRLAGSDATVWTPLVAANRDAIARHAAAVTARLVQILEGEGEAEFAQAQELWRKLQ